MGPSRHMSLSQKAHYARLARSQRRETSMDPYFSMVGWIPALTGAGPFVYTIAAGTQVRAFSYAIGQDMASGGNPGVFAADSDTNIVTAGKTIGGRAVEIQGLSLQILPNVVAASLVAGLFSLTSTRLLFNGSETNILLGAMYFIPGGPGLYGAQGEDLTKEPAIPGGKSWFGFSSNGLPGRDNILKIREGIIWQPEGESDSSLVIQFTTNRAAVANAPIDEAAAAGIRGYTHPTAAALTIQCMMQLHGRVVGPRSHIV